MFTRKISSQSFDDALGDYRHNPHILHEESFEKSNPDEATHHFDPQTGEILSPSTPKINAQSAPKSNTEKHYFSQFKQEKLNISSSLLFLLISIHLILSVSVTYLITTHLLKNQTLQLEKNAELLTELKKNQISSVDVLHEIQENISESSQEGQPQDISNSDLASNLEAKFEALLQKNIFNPQKTIPSSARTQKVAQLKNIKYLGSIKKHDKHHVLIDIDSVVKQIEIGEVIREGWRLAAIEPQKIILATPNGQRHILHLHKGVQ